MTEKNVASPRCLWWKRALLGFTALIALAAGGGVYAFHAVFLRPMPDYQGQAALAGLEQPVGVLRDAHGVPHIFATSTPDALRALGYVHAGERFFQMETQRRAGQGRLSEIFGPVTLEADKLVRTLGLYALAQSSFEALSPDAQTQFKAYTEGVNAWLTTHRDRLPPEFRLLGFAPEPWQPADSVVWGKLMALQLSKNMELDRLRMHLIERVPFETWQSLFPRSFDTPVTTSPLRTKTGMGPDEGNLGLAQLGRVTKLDHGASNEWVVAGSRTVSGKPILANDPHLGLEAPILWYLARIVTPEGEVKGATVPGLPVVLLGQNNSIAWGFTTTQSDVQDLFIETLDKDDPAFYLTPFGKRAFATHEEILHVKGAPDVKLTVRATRHGPVLSDIDADLARLAGLDGPGRVMALAFTGLGGKDTTAEALLRINHAKDWTAFCAALKLYQGPPQNIVYADTAGHIGFFAPGLLPVRNKSAGTSPADGASGRFDWVGSMPFTQAPQLYDPPAGYIFNANNAIVGPAFPYWLGSDWEESFRAQRLQQFFDGPDKHDLDFAARMQADHVSLAARELLPILLRVPATEARAVEALDLLRRWDGAMERDRPEPLIFTAWLYELNRALFAEGLGDPLKEKGPLKASLLPMILNDTSGAWCPVAEGAAGPCDALLLRTLDKALVDLTRRQGTSMTAWRWGRAHRAILTHKIFSHVPVLRDFADLSVPSSGDFYTLDRGGSFVMAEPEPFARTHGGGFRGLYDLADPALSRFMIATGQSGHVFSPHYGDLVALWNDVKAITIAGSPDDLRRAGAVTLNLTPAALPSP